VNHTYAEMATHHGTVIIAARPYKPRDKSKVEAGVQVVRALDPRAAAQRGVLHIGAS